MVGEDILTESPRETLLWTLFGLSFAPWVKVSSKSKLSTSSVGTVDRGAVCLAINSARSVETVLA
jgi:hypothetical protein